MLSDWIHWLSSKRPDELLLLMLPWLLLDTPRYGLGSIAVCFGDAFKSALPRNLRNDNNVIEWDYPNVFEASGAAGDRSAHGQDRNRLSL